MTLAKAAKVITGDNPAEDYTDDGIWGWNEIIDLAKQAPSSHNSQPWSITIQNDRVDVYCDMSRRLQVADHDMREVYISCGAFARFIQITANAGGRMMDLSWIADGDQEQPVAILRQSDNCICKHEDVAKVYAMRYRSTYRGEFTKRDIEQNILMEIAEKNMREAIKAVTIEGQDRENLLNQIFAANRIEYNDPAFRGELMRWIRSSKSEMLRSKDGIPWYALGLGKTQAYFFRKILSRFNIAETVNKKDLKKLRSSKSLLVIASRDDSRASLLDVGAFLADLILDLCLVGIYVAFYNQPIQVSEQRISLKENLNLDFYPHLIIALGYPKHLPLQRTPRRATEDIIKYITFE